tara:strand:- start:116 stop:328 length:213 start_codon:yes stop_codon:yes gene_type:complete
MDKYLGKVIDVWEDDNYIFYMELDKIITKPTGENDITRDVDINEYPIFVDRSLDSYCTLKYVKNNLMYVK